MKRLMTMLIASLMILFGFCACAQVPTDTPTFPPYPDVEPGSSDPFLRPSDFQPLLIEAAGQLYQLTPLATPEPTSTGSPYPTATPTDTPTNTPTPTCCLDPDDPIFNASQLMGIPFVAATPHSNYAVPVLWGQGTENERFAWTYQTDASWNAYALGGIPYNDTTWPYDLTESGFVTYQATSATPGDGTLVMRTFAELIPTDTPTNTPTNTPTPTITPTMIPTMNPATPHWNAGKIRGITVSSTAPTEGQVLMYSMLGPQLTYVNLPTQVPTHTPTNTPVPTSTSTPTVTPTPYVVPVTYEDPTYPLTHTELQAIYGNPTAIPDGTIEFLYGSGDDYMHLVAVYDSRFFVSGLTPIPTPTIAPTATPTQAPDYIVSSAGTSAVNGDYYENGTYDSVACYEIDGGGYWLYRCENHKAYKMWVIHDVKQTGIAESNYLYSYINGDPDPPRVTFDIGTGSSPGAVVSLP